MFSLQISIIAVSLFSYWAWFAFGKTVPNDEVVLLKSIAKQFGKTDWNFAADPCSEEFVSGTHDPSYDSVGCNCSTTVCHVVSIVIINQSLPGILPAEIAKLPYLQELDLMRNYLKGSIPPQWGSMQQLDNISLSMNRISGPIPKELTNITTLRALLLEANHLSGEIPPEIGNLFNLQRLILSSNNLTGELPGNLVNLTNLMDLRISDNHFTGKIPSFIQNWTKLEKLFVQASGLEGPIPSGISLLTKLSDLRISDLDGKEAPFPHLDAMQNMKTLILRSCNIIGELPGYLGNMSYLKLIDLSFNNLSGQIPSNFHPVGVDYIYLTGNKLTGIVPDWMLHTGAYINLFGSSLLRTNSDGVAPCLKKFTCPRRLYSEFHINCGGKEVIVGGNTKYEDDTAAADPSWFYQNNKTNWAVSSTGNFMDDDMIPDKSSTISPHSLTSDTLMMNNSQLYMTARISPLSLTYYGFCLVNGNYKLDLHFAEIMFTNDETVGSLGRRIFNIYIQGKLEWKDFNIEDEAGGAGIPKIKTFTAVVTSNTLEIRFYWAGKGTTGIPVRGTYGPLISAISVNHDSELLPDGETKIPGGAIGGIVVSIFCLIIVILGILWWKGYFGQKTTYNEVGGRKKAVEIFDLLEHQVRESGGDELPQFDFNTILISTNNFTSKLGEGGFGPVYQGELLDGQEIAVKRLSRSSGQGIEEFKNELRLISKLQHRNLVRLVGFCIENEEKILVYEYMPHGSLDAFIFDTIRQSVLDWDKRFRIVDGIAQGLLYLHHHSRVKVIHRDLKASNILLDEDMKPKISDFGMARIFAGSQILGNTNRIVGTYGYMSPEYAMEGIFSEKSDVFSFGVLLLEIVSSKRNTSFYHNEEHLNLLGYAWRLWNEGQAEKLIDPTLINSNSMLELMRCIHIGLLCVQEHAVDRPTISTIVFMLGNDTTLPTPKQPAFILDKHLLPVTSQTLDSISLNDVTMTSVGGR